MKFLLASAPFLLAALLLGSPARGDVAPPETQDCRTKAAGDACVYNNAAGTCQNQMCLSASSGSYACLECITGTSTATSTNTTTKTDGGPPLANDSGSCSIGRQATVKRIAPWFLAGAFSLLFLFGRRRPQG
jgi:hypothetical protein